MKQINLKHLFKLAGKSGEPMGCEEPAIYFDGQNAVAASEFATLSIDCPQEISEPVIVSVSDLKSALHAAPILQFRRSADGQMRINDVRVAATPAEALMPPTTAEMINLDKTAWRPIVRPFRLDGGRLRQLGPAMAVRDVRYYLNGLYLDFATGAIVALDGKRLHLIEDAVPIVDLPPERKQGVILPASMANMLSSVGGVMDVFVMERTETSAEGKTGTKRMICVAAANARFRIREVDSDTFPNYRDPFDRNRNQEICIVLDAQALQDLIAVATIADENNNHPYLQIEGEGRQVVVSHLDKIVRPLPMNYRIGGAFSVTANGRYILDAIRSAGGFGSAVRMRFGRGDESRGIYVGAQDFHSIVMTITESSAETSEKTAAQAQTA